MLEVWSGREDDEMLVPNHYTKTVNLPKHLYLTPTHRDWEGQCGRSYPMVLPEFHQSIMLTLKYETKFENIGCVENFTSKGGLSTRKLIYQV